MGGHAFTERGLSTPRMPSAVYEFVSKLVEEKLALLFQEVAHPIEAPGKNDYGDLDVLVLPDSGAQILQGDEIARFLRAKMWYHTQSNGTMHFALPWPEDPSSSSINVSNHNITEAALEKQENELERYVQLDLRICSSEQDFNWRLFVHAHGDFINIIASMIRHKGLTITDQALYLRIPNIEMHNRKLARVELSRNPDQVLRYLGLSPARFWQPFRSLDEMMTYIATCRFHDPAHISSDPNHTEIRDSQGVKQAALNLYENHPFAKRPVFRYWFGTFLPAHINDPLVHLLTSAEDILDDISSFFGPDTKEKYEKQKQEVTTTVARSTLWSTIRSKLLEVHPDISDSDLHDTIKALKRDVLSPLPPPPPPPLSTDMPVTPPQTAYASNDFEAVISWCLAHHASSLSRYRQRLLQEQTSRPLDKRKANKYSTHDVETYTAAEDEVIVGMKEGGATWSDILDVLGKKSRSQLIAHWKERLRPEETSDEGDVGGGGGSA